MATTLDPRWLGRRVSVRHPAPTRDDPAHLADVVGDLVALTGGVARVETRRGTVDVALEQVVAARRVESTTPDQLALEQVAALGWRAAETDLTADGWLLRADPGGTGRATSALALTTPRRPLAETLAEARAWYAARGLPLQLTVPLPARSLLDGALEDHGLVARAQDDVHVFVGRLDRLAAGPLTDRAAAADPDLDVDVELADRPDDAWLALARGGRVAGSPAFARLAARHADPADVVFATVRSDGEPVAVGRGVVDRAPAGRDGSPGDRWLGLTGVEVAPDHRRRGLGAAVVRALWAWGAGRGATRSWLQVASGNQPAVAMYLGAGYWHHHDYRYRRDPSAPAS